MNFNVVHMLYEWLVQWWLGNTQRFMDRELIRASCLSLYAVCESGSRSPPIFLAFTLPTQCPGVCSKDLSHFDVCARRGWHTCATGG